MITNSKKLQVRSYLAMFFIVFLSGFSQIKSLTNTDKIQIINEKIKMVTDSLTNNAIEIEQISKYMKRFERPFTILPSRYKPDHERYQKFPKTERDTYELELAKTVFTQVKAPENYKEIAYIYTEYIRDSNNQPATKINVIACERGMDICSQIHQGSIESGTTSVFQHFDDNWIIVGYYYVY